MTTDVLASPLSRLMADLDEELLALDAQDLRRRLTTIDAVNGPVVRLDGRDVVCWCSNDYLGLSLDPALARAASEAAAHWGVGARASRLLAGTTRWHRDLEAALAAWYGAEDALVFASGYLANLGALGTLVSSEDVIVIDRLAHASLIDAARATRARLLIFDHNDASDAARLLARAAAARRRFVVTEGLFSMDGDQSPLAQLLEVATNHDAILYLDDAHGAFALGATGRGTPEAAGISHNRLLYMGTLGKALGCQGGFLVGPRTLTAALHNRARAFIYATALAVPIAAAAREALRVLEQDTKRRVRLNEQVLQLQARLEAMGLIRRAPPSHIVPVMVGDAGGAMELARRLLARGIWAPAIRPPTVPRGTARLRLSVTALHTGEQIDALVLALKAIGVRSSECGMRNGE